MKDYALGHRVNRTFLPAVIVLFFVALAPSVSLAQSCEVPLFVRQNLLGANLMLLVDNSVSMNAATYHGDYDPKTVYSGYFDTESTYHVNRGGIKTPYDFDRDWPDTPSASLIDSEMGQDGLYSGNYMNWIYCNATEEQRNSIPQVTRIQVLKSVLYDLIYRSPRLQLGLTVFFPHGDGGNILAYCEGNNEMAVASVINGMVANAYTQLGEAMESILDYYVHGGDNGFPSIVSPCQYNFIVVVTDGMPTMDTNVSPYLHDADGDGMDPGDCESVGSPYSNFMGCSDHFDDVAYYMAHNDIRSDMEGDQHVYTYVVGFHEDGRLLRDAAENGLGLYFHAENSTELALSIEYAVQDILRRISAGSAVAVVSTEQGTDDRLYRGKFMPIDWVGYMECFSLPYNDGDPTTWEAGNLLMERNPSTRKIFTALGENKLDFKSGSAGILRDKMAVATEEEAADLIDWGCGEDVNGYRNRQGWVLGDIIHSTPVVVGPPSNFAMEESYQNFLTANANRRKVVYVGANDGMLHAFDALTGEESWAFVPEFALPKFSVMADSFYCHTYTCDQTPTVKDLKIGGTWKTVLATGGREGGSSIFALDITNPDSPDVLWQNDVPNGKSFTSDVRLANIGNVPVALVGSGYDPDDNEAWLYGYEMNGGNLTGSVRLSDFRRDPNKATRPEVVDLDLDGNVDLAYIADLGGDLWRVDFNGSTNSGSWDVTKLYDGSEPITANPVAAYGENGSVNIYFGTGLYLTDADMESLHENRFVCVFDHHDGSTRNLGDLVDQTTTISSIDSARGWFVKLWNDEGERVTEQAAVVAETVIFTSFKPSMDPCVAGGQSWLYQLAYDTGGIAPGNEDGDESSRSTDLGEGIASHAVIDLNQGTAVIQSSDATITVAPVEAIYDRLVVRSWQEDFSIVETPSEGGGGSENDGDNDDIQ